MPILWLTILSLDLYPRKFGTELPKDTHKNVNSRDRFNNQKLIIFVTIKNSSLMMTKQKVFEKSEVYSSHDGIAWNVKEQITSMNNNVDEALQPKFERKKLTNVISIVVILLGRGETPGALWGAGNCYLTWVLVTHVYPNINIRRACLLQLGVSCSLSLSLPTVFSIS